MLGRGFSSCIPCSGRTIKLELETDEIRGDICFVPSSHGSKVFGDGQAGLYKLHTLPTYQPVPRKPHVQYDDPGV